METYNAWWGGLTTLNQWFFIAAAFFSVIFGWQLIMALMGLGGHDGDVDSHVEDSGEHQTPGDAEQTVMAFKLLSVRSILSFFTLFTWAGALYMSRGVSVSLSLAYALAWGIAAMVLVSLLFYMMRRLAETGNIKVSSTVGALGAVYLDIPANGTGEVRVLCSGVMTHFKARVAGGAPLKTGTQVKVARALDGTMIEVAPVDSATK